MPKTRNRFSRAKSTISFTHEDPLTKQADKDSCDINLIMARYTKTGIIEHGNKHQAQYGVVPETDFRQALEVIQTSSDMFDELPAKVRRRFNNNPAEFLGFCDNPDNLTEARLLGLADPEPAKPATEPDRPTPAPDPSLPAPT